MPDINKPLFEPGPILGPDKPDYPNLSDTKPVPSIPSPVVKGPGILGRVWLSLWENRWNILRHAILGAAAVGGILLAKSQGASNGETGTAATLIIALRKWIDDELRSHGHKDMISFVLSLIQAAAVAAKVAKPKQKEGGAIMGIRTEVEEVRDALANLALAVFSKDEDKAAKILSGIMGIIKEGADVVSIPKEDIPEAAAHALSGAAAIVIASKVVYSDEVVHPPTT